MDEMERCTQQARLFYRRRGVFVDERSVRMRHKCGVRWAWSITWAPPRMSIGLPQQRNPCTDCKSAQ